MRQLVLFACLAATWLLWSGIYTPLLLTLGLASSVLVVLISQRMGFFYGDVFSLHILHRLPRYWLWLSWQLIKSNLDVTRIVLTPHMPVRPRLVTLDARPLSPVGIAIFGNSITLTPGTVTLAIDGHKVLVHCLTTETARSLVQGELKRHIEQLMHDVDTDSTKSTTDPSQAD
jgi:multicomponent Na+:H+ antiporter subunit E